MITIPIHTRMSIIEEAHYRRFQLPSFINWSIPVLGFIGTVLGISLSSENIQKVISNDESMSNMSKGISEAIAPLGIAFDTTLVALSLGIISTFFTLVSSNSERKYISELQVHLERGEYEKSRDNIESNEGIASIEVFGGVFAILMVLFLIINLLSSARLEERLDRLSDEGDFKIKWGEHGNGFVIITYPDSLFIIETGEFEKYDDICGSNRKFIDYTRKIYSQKILKSYFLS